MRCLWGRGRGRGRYLRDEVIAPELLELDNISPLEVAPAELDGPAVGLALAVGLHGALGVIELVKQADTFDIPGGAVTETSTLAWFKEQDALRCHSG